MMAHRGKPRATVGLASIAVVLTVVMGALVLGPTLGAVAAAPATAPSLATAGDGHAGGNDSGNVSNVTIYGHDDRGQYIGNVTYGFVVNMTATNTSANVTAVALEETYGISLHVTYCRPTCAQPRTVVNFTYVAFEQHDVFANVTTAANVTLRSNDTTSVVAAWGLLNSSRTTRARATESVTGFGPRFEIADENGTSNGTARYSVQASAEYRANSSVAFSTPLGLAPLGSLAPGMAWTSSAAYTGGANWAAQGSINVTVGNRSSEIPFSAAASVGPLGGTVTLRGSAGRDFEESHVGAVTPVEYDLSTERLAMTGPFAIGVAVPDGWGDSFGGAWQAFRFAGGIAQFGPALLTPHGGGLGRFQGSRMNFDASIATTMLGPGSSSDGSLAAANLSGEPMTAAQAAATGSCLQSGTCASPGSGLPSPGLGTGTGPMAFSSGLGALLVASAIVAAAAAVGAVLAFGRRGPKPPTHLGG